MFASIRPAASSRSNSCFRRHLRATSHVFSRAISTRPQDPRWSRRVIRLLPAPFLFPPPTFFLYPTSSANSMPPRQQGSTRAWPCVPAILLNRRTATPLFRVLTGSRPRMPRDVLSEPREAAKAALATVQLNKNMKISLLRIVPILTLFVLACSATQKEFEYLGEWSNVEVSSSEDPHASGYVLQLWKHKGKPVGFFTEFAGPP